MMDNKLGEIYYSTQGYWKGYAAIPKLAERSSDDDLAKRWLEKQAIWQIYLPAPKYIPRAHWVVDKRNYLQQADLFFFFLLIRGKIRLGGSGCSLEIY